MKKCDPLDLQLIHWSREFSRLKEEIALERRRRIRAEEKLERRSRNGKVVDRISTLFLAVREKELFLQTCLETVGRAMDLSRTYVVDPGGIGGGVGEGGIEWTAPGVPPHTGAIHPLVPGLTSWWKDMMANRLVLRYRDVQEIPASPEREILRARGVKSILAVPLFVMGRYRGFMGLDECRDHREWFEEEIDLVRTVSKMMVEFLEHRETEEELKERDKGYRFLLQHFTGITFVSDLDLSPRSVHGAVEMITGYGREEITSGGLPWKLLVHPADLPLLSESSARLASIAGYRAEREYRIVRKDGAVRWVHETVWNTSDETGTPVLLHGVLYDITAMRKLRLERDLLLKEIEKQDPSTKRDNTIQTD